MFIRADQPSKLFAPIAGTLSVLLIVIVASVLAFVILKRRLTKRRGRQDVNKFELVPKGSTMSSSESERRKRNAQTKCPVAKNGFVTGLALKFVFSCCREL